MMIQAVCGRGEEEEESTVEPATPSLSIEDWVLVKYDSEEYPDSEEHPGRKIMEVGVDVGAGLSINQEYVSVSDRGDNIYYSRDKIVKKIDCPVV